MSAIFGYIFKKNCVFRENSADTVIIVLMAKSVCEVCNIHFSSSVKHWCNM